MKDLKLIRQGQSEARRTEDCYIGTGRSVYFPDTSEVIRSAQKGDLYAFAQVGKLILNEELSLTAFPGPGNTMVISHGLGYIPVSVILKKVIVGPTVTWVDAQGTIDVTHNEDFTETTLTNTVAVPLVFLLRIG